MVLGAILKPIWKVSGSFQKPLFFNFYDWLDIDSFEGPSLVCVGFWLRDRLAFCCMIYMYMGRGTWKIPDVWMREFINFTNRLRLCCQQIL